MYIYMCVYIYTYIESKVYEPLAILLCVLGVRGLLGPERIGRRPPLLARRSFGGANLYICICTSISFYLLTGHPSLCS